MRLPLGEAGKDTHLCGVFLEAGEETARQHACISFGTKWPASRSPRLESATLDGKTRRKAIETRPKLPHQVHRQISTRSAFLSLGGLDRTLI
jgi:hypothetical protein